MINRPSNSTGISTAMDNKGQLLLGNHVRGTTERRSPPSSKLAKNNHTLEAAQSSVGCVGTSFCEALRVRMIAAWESFVTTKPKQNVTARKGCTHGHLAIAYCRFVRSSVQVMHSTLLGMAREKRLVGCSRKRTLRKRKSIITLAFAQSSVSQPCRLYLAFRLLASLC